MEKEGLRRTLNFLYKRDLTVDSLVTDQHRQINIWLRDTHPEIKHYYDCLACGKRYNPLLC